MKTTVRAILMLTIFLLLLNHASADTEVTFEDLFNNHGSVMLLIDVEEGNIIDANEAAVNFYGYSREELLDKSIQDINTLTPEEVEQERFSALEENRNCFFFSHRLKNGDIKNVEVYSYPIKQGDKDLLYSIVHDITPRVQMEEIIRRDNLFIYLLLGVFIIVQTIGIIIILSNIKKRNKTQAQLDQIYKEYEIVFNSTENAIFLVEVLGDNEFRYIRTNRYHQIKTGITLEDIKGKTPEELLGKDLGENISNNYNRCVKENNSIDYEESLELVGGFRIWLTKLTPIEEDGKVKYIVGSSTDITQQKEIEKLMREERRLFKTTLLSVGDGVISIDKSGNVKLINKVAEILTGWIQEQAVGEPFEKVFNIINEFTREKCDNPVNKVLETGQIMTLENNTILVSKTGIERPIEDSAAPIIDKYGNTIGVVLVFRDFSEKKERQSRIEYLSYHDQLTGLYNRRYFEEQLLNLGTEDNLPLSIIMADVNGLKLTNDAFGHAIGDRLLKKAADVMGKECREKDILARIGGDEFVIILPKTTRSEAENIVNRIKELCSDTKVGSVILSISLGFETKLNNKQYIDEVFKKAEDSMYRIKLIESPKMRRDMIQSIIENLKKDNKIEAKHSDRVTDLCRKITSAFGLSEEYIGIFKTACLLHDIGKIAIDDKILNKTAELTEDEWVEIKRHPEIGYRILSSVNEYSDVAEFVLAHHERWDGKGYPKGLSGEEIPLVSRIIAIADAYDAMTSKRPYRKALSHKQAVKEIKENSGTQFDPNIAKSFVEEVLNSTFHRVT